MTESRLDGVVVDYVTRRDSCFSVGYTFPTGTSAISAGVMGRLLDVAVFEAILASVTGMLVVVWTVTTALTDRMVLRSHVFTPE